MTAREDLFAAIATATARGRYDETAMIGLVDALVTDALVAAGVKYVDCHLCGAARPVEGTCGNCTFKAWAAAEQAARGLTAVDVTEGKPAPDFFVPGRTYSREHHGDTIQFLVENVSTSPDARYRVAHGWRTRSWDPGWEPSDSDDFTLWVDVTEAGGVRG